MAVGNYEVKLNKYHFETSPGLRHRLLLSSASVRSPLRVSEKITDDVKIILDHIMEMLHDF